MPPTVSSPPTAEQVTQALAGVNDPEIHRPITELGMVKNIAVGEGGVVRVDIYLTVAGCPLRDTITRDVTAAVSKLPGNQAATSAVKPVSITKLRSGPIAAQTK